MSSSAVPTDATPQSGTGFVKAMTLTDATMLVAGSMIGSGIFIVSASMARELPSPLWMILAWVLSGVMTLLGALAYGELAAMYPKAGGQCPHGEFVSCGDVLLQGDFARDGPARHADDRSLAQRHQSGGDIVHGPQPSRLLRILLCRRVRHPLCGTGACAAISLSCFNSSQNAPGIAARQWARLSAASCGVPMPVTTLAIAG